jgi:glycosyltransferase involved in cell wall biosynthesis
MSPGNIALFPQKQSEAPPPHEAGIEGRMVSSMLAPLCRYSLELRDLLISTPIVRATLSQCIRLWDGKPDRNDPQAVARSIRRLCSAARLAPTAKIMRRVEVQILRRIEQLDAAKLDWKEFIPDFENRTLGKAVILKPCLSEREKGVLFVSFGNQWVRLLGVRDLNELARSYSLVVAPPWSPPHDLTNYVFPRTYPGNVFTLISNIRDVETFQRLSRDYRVVPLYASNWVNPDEFDPLPSRERDIDIIMVANFGRFKRHFALFKALRKMPPQLRVVLIGQDQDGRGTGAIYKEAKYYNVHKRITISGNVPRREVVGALCRSRVSLILSRREGSCTVVAESLFANAPVGMLEDARVGSRAFINESTGYLLKHGDLSGQLRDFLDRAAEYSPREWAERNISCHRSSALLNDTIRSHMLQSGQEWTQDIATLCLSPDPRLFFPQDQLRMHRARADFQDRFGLVIGAA